MSCIIVFLTYDLLISFKVVPYRIHEMNFYLFSLTHSTIKRLAVAPYGGTIMDVVAISLVVTVIMQVMISVITLKLTIH